MMYRWTHESEQRPSQCYCFMLRLGRLRTRSVHTTLARVVQRTYLTGVPCNLHCNVKAGLRLRLVHVSPVSRSPCWNARWNTPTVNSSADLHAIAGTSSRNSIIHDSDTCGAQIVQTSLFVRLCSLQDCKM